MCAMLCYYPECYMASETSLVANLSLRIFVTLASYVQKEMYGCSLLHHPVGRYTLSLWRGSPFHDSMTHDLMTLNQLNDDTRFMTPVT